MFNDKEIEDEIFFYLSLLISIYFIANFIFYSNNLIITYY